jgi:hypothetical protein
MSAPMTAEPAPVEPAAPLIEVTPSTPAPQFAPPPPAFSAPPPAFSAPPPPMYSPPPQGYQSAPAQGYQSAPVPETPGYMSAPPPMYGGTPSGQLPPAYGSTPSGQLPPAPGYQPQPGYPPSGQLPPQQGYAPGYPPSGQLPPQQGYAPQQPYMAAPVVVVQQNNNKGLAIALEIIGGLFGIFGIGWLVAGKSNVGIPLLIGGIVWFLIEIVLLFLVVGVFCDPIISLAVMITSTVMLNNALNKQNVVVGVGQYPPQYPQQ